MQDFILLKFKAPGIVTQTYVNTNKYIRITV